MDINFNNYNHIINELGCKPHLTESEHKMLSRALTLEKIEYDCRCDSYEDYDNDD